MSDSLYTVRKCKPVNSDLANPWLPEAEGGSGGEMGGGKDEERSIRGRRKGVVCSLSGLW